MQVVLPTRLSSVLAGAALLVVAACSAPAPPAAPPAPAAATADEGGDAAHGGDDGAHGGDAGGGHSGHGNGGLGLYAVQTGTLGVVTTEADGRLVYMHTGDTPTSSACTGACAEEWLPLLRTEGVEPELLGVDAELVGELPRPEGVQLTLAGHPLYHRADDSGLITEADAAWHRTDGAWFVISPQGEPLA